MTLRSILTTWSENVDDYMDDFLREIKESYRTYNLVATANKDKPDATPFSNAKYQEDLLSIRKSILNNLDMAKVQVDAHHKLIDDMYALGKIDEDFYDEIIAECIQLTDEIGFDIVQVGVYYARYKGASGIDLSINFKTNDIHVSSL